MKTLRALALWAVLISAGFFVFRGAARSGHHYRLAREAALSATNAASYTRGFFAGFNATLKHINFDTNSGKFTVEMTNVLSELKP